MTKIKFEGAVAAAGSSTEVLITIDLRLHGRNALTRVLVEGSSQADKRLLITTHPYLWWAWCMRTRVWILTAAALLQASMPSSGDVTSWWWLRLTGRYVFAIET